jgi:hypothetical protein
VNAKRKRGRNEHRELPRPPSCGKLIHRWRDRQRLPDVREVIP